jgi:hypothetical protein
MEYFVARGFVDVCGRLFEGASRERANGDVCAFAGNLFRYGAAEFFAGRCDYRHLACESQIHSGTLIKTLIVSRNVGCVNITCSLPPDAGSTWRRILFAWRGTRH